jgi:hypothetical protein
MSPPESIKDRVPDPHASRVAEFLALAPDQRYRQMAIPLGEPHFVVDEVIAAVSRKAHREKWKDSNRYNQHLINRVYRHVRGHLSKNSGWAARAGGPESARDDFAGHVLAKLIGETATPSHAEVAFGDYVYKRCLDYADELFAKKRNAGESLTELSEADAIEYDAQLGGSSATQSIEDELIHREEQKTIDEQHTRVCELLQEDGFLTEKERMAFAFHHVGQIQIRSDDSAKMTVCKLMDCSDRSARLYVKSAIAKIKEKLQ